ncbi:hypothetical protein GJV06_08525 [Enterobacteriaceae bacterium RIT691]|nr:hypothetical protein [Enterobacteriaceae bacterium RIT691]
MKVNKLFACVGVLLLAGCTTSAQRMAECEAQGISKETCYLAEVQHKEAINQAAYNAAYANARDAVKQHGQSAKKSKAWEGMTLVVNANGLTVEGKPAAVVEKTAKATVYQQGLFNYIVYSNGKIGVTDLNNVFKGYAK